MGRNGPLDILIVSDETTTLSQSVGNELPSDVLSYSRWIKTFVTPLQKPESLHKLFCVEDFVVKGIERSSTRNLKCLLKLNFFYHKL